MHLLSRIPVAWILRSASALILVAGSSSLFASQIYITGFSTDNDIYTNLNEQYPNTGPGAPGSTVGTPNATYLYDPSTYTSTNFVAGSDNATNGIDFDLASDAAGQDFDQITNGAPLSVTTTVADATNVYLLTGSYNGSSGETVTFTGTGGATDTFTSLSNPDFCNGGAIAGTPGAYEIQSVLEVHDVGACGSGNSTSGATTNYYLYEQEFTLNSSFNGQTLTGISVSNSDNTLLLLGITALSSPTATPEPSTLLLSGLALAGLSFFARRRRAA